MLQRRRHRHGRRYRQIANILARHGLGYFSSALGLARFVPLHRGWLGHARRAEPYTQAEHLRLAVEELGVTFIKLGQILSTRPDLLAPEYLTELAKLQDAAPPVAPDIVRAVIEEQLGRPLSAVFASFEPVPLAAASIGQAHAATLPDGDEVVVKVRRPGVVEQVEEDLEIFQNLALSASQRWEAAAQYDLVGLAHEFAESLRAELDYIREARNAERIAANFADDPAVHIPRVVWAATTARVLTLERIRGIKINDVAALDAAGIDRAALAQRAARVVLQMVFEDGFFHADPHPGNFFIEPTGRIGLIDFGMVGVIDLQTQARLVDLLIAVASQDPDRLVDAVLALGVSRGPVDRATLRRDVQRLVASYVGRALGEIEVGAVINDVLAVVRQHHLHLPVDLALVLKMGVMLEGVGRQLDPSFQLMTALQPFGRRLLLRRYSPWFWGERLGRAGWDAAQLGVELPGQLRRLLGDLERGALEVGVHPREVEPIIQRLEGLTNRLVLGMLASAFIIGLAVLMTVYHPPGWDRWAGITFAISFLVAATLGLYLVWTILRSRRR